MTRLIMLLIIPLLMGFTPAEERVQLNERNTPAIIKASYIYNFAKLISWPEKVTKGNFIIGVLGDPDLYKQIVEKYSGKQIGSQSIEVIQLLGHEQLPKTHMLFVSRSMSDKVQEISNQLNKTSSLLISERDNGLSLGAVINFVVVDNQQKFEISESNAGAHELTIGTTLKSLAHKLEK